MQHLRQTVRFSDGLQELLRKPGQILLEVGPGQHTEHLRQAAVNWCSFIGRSSCVRCAIQKTRNRTSHSCLTPWARLWLAGVRINWSGFYSGEQRRRVSLPTYPFEHQRYWIDPGKQVQAASPSNGSLKKKQNIADWFYLPTWKETVLPASWESNDLKGEELPWLVFANECGFSSRLVERLASQATRGQRTTVSPPLCLANSSESSVMEFIP